MMFCGGQGDYMPVLMVREVRLRTGPDGWSPEQPGSTLVGFAFAHGAVEDVPTGWAQRRESPQVRLTDGFGAVREAAHYANTG
ncbi:hypothetical protein KY386_01175 [Candidatus Parcubacteria bacterium]|nr:hypothetical protein [Candidatus Parcubacteria bacterium]